jgi:replicative DNA helicase
MSDRTQPHSLEAERSVLGAILIDVNAINLALEVITPADFYRFAHRLIFEAMIALNQTNDPIDLITLSERLNRAGHLAEVGGAAYVSQLTDGVPRAVNVQHYANIVKEKATLRALIASANEVLSRAFDGAVDADEQLDEAERSIFQIADGRLRSGFVSLGNLVDNSYQMLEKLQEQRGAITGVPTGFHDLDEMTSGFQPGDLVILAARPGVGKTSFVLNVAVNAAKQSGLSVGVFSLEMSKEQLFMRLLTSEAKVDGHRMRTGYLGEQDYDRIALALSEMHDLKVFIDDTPSIGVLEMRAKARRLKKEHGLNMLIVDYLQLMQGGGRFESRQVELASISRSLKILAKELGIPIVALSQLSRAAETRSDHRPQLSDLRESGALEQDADIVMFIFRAEMYNTPEEHNAENDNKATIIVGKQRNGPTGDVDLAFLKAFTRFESLAPERR